MIVDSIAWCDRIDLLRMNDPTSTESNPGQGDATNNSLNEFSGCHQAIIDNFRQLQDLLRIIDDKPDSRETRKMAKKLIGFFKDIVLTHHAEEEQELFTAVMDSAASEEEASRPREYIKRLVAEHRELERMWLLIEPDIKLLAKGKASHLDRVIAASLAQQYLEHADFEERVFLPLAAEMLSKNELSALGMSMHMRHQEAASLYHI